MFGLEKKKKKQKAFEFDLEKELKSDGHKRAKLLEEISKHKLSLKTMLREGAKGSDFEHCGVLLQGFDALEKTIHQIEEDV
jgi:hypothetical protein